MAKWIVICALLLAAPAQAASMVLVGQLRPQGVDKELAATLADLLAGELANRTSRSVSTEAQAIATLKAGATAQALGNQVDTEHLAAQFQAEFLLTGSVGRVGRIFVLSLDVGALSANARATLNGRRNHWSLVAAAEPESLIVAAQKGAEAVAAALLSPEEERQAALAAAREREEERARMEAASSRAEEEQARRQAAAAAAQAASADPARAQALNSSGDKLNSDVLDNLTAKPAPPSEGPSNDFKLDAVARSSLSSVNLPAEEPPVDLNTAATANAGASSHDDALSALLNERKQQEEAGPKVEVLAADPVHLENQPEWHVLAGQELGPGEQTSLLASLKRKLPARK